MKLVWSSFYFGTLVTESSFILDLTSASVDYAVRVPYGRYAPKTFRAVLEANILSQTGLATLVDFDYSTRTYRLTFPSSVTLNGATGPNAGESLLPVLGLPLTDQTGTVFTGSGGSSLKFEPNFPLVNFTDKTNTVEIYGLETNESAGQLRDAVGFGTRRFYRFLIKYLTDYPQNAESYIKSNVKALTEARDFIFVSIVSGSIDFFYDKSVIGSNYTTRPTDTIQLSLQGQGQQNGIELLEMIDAGLSSYYSLPLLRYDVFNLEPLSDTTPGELARLLQEMGDLILQEDGGGILL